MDPGTPREEHTLNANITACHIADLVTGSRIRRVSLLSAPALQSAIKHNTVTYAEAAWTCAASSFW